MLCYLTQCSIADYLNKLTIYYLTAFDKVKVIHSKTMPVVGNTFVNQLDIHFYLPNLLKCVFCLLSTSK